MTNMSKKYAALGDYLDTQTDNEVSLSFEQIEEILQGRLPESASVYDAWWSNSPLAGRHNYVWLTRGWETSGLDRKAGTVRFARSPSPRTMAANPKPRTRSAIPPSSASLETAPVTASNNVMYSFEWKELGEITLDMEGGLVFPAVTLGAGLYRIRIVLMGGRASMLVNPKVCAAVSGITARGRRGRKQAIEFTTFSRMPWRKVRRSWWISSPTAWR